MNATHDDSDDEFVRLFEAHAAALNGFIRALLPTAAAAEEVLQTVRIVLWRKFSEFDRQRDFRGWAFGIARLEVLASRRDRARDRLRFQPELIQQLAEDAEVSADRHECERTALEECLQKLSDDDRRLVLAAYAREASIKQLAEQRGQTAMALYKILQRLRQQLLACVQRRLARESWE